MPAGITIIGLGPGRRQFWTQAALTALNQAEEVYLRTARHPGVADIFTPIHDFDEVFDQADDGEESYRQIAIKLVQLGQRAQGVFYAVPGHPLVDEPTTTPIRALAQSYHLPVAIIPGLSLVETAQALLGLDSSAQLQIVAAPRVASLHHPPLAPDRPALITHLHQSQLAARVQQTLLNAYPSRLTATLVRPTAPEPDRLQPCALTDLPDQAYFDLDTILYLPADPANTSFTTFQETIAHLRAPEGCPWDRQQTHQSLRPFLLEETYEVLETLDANDPVGLAEELGDVLLQVVLHTQIATDTGEFKMGEVINHIHRKLWRRHPHVFGNVTVNNAEEVTTNWEAIKKAEKADKGQPVHAASALDGVPPALPALAQALTISRKAAQAGFEWPNIEGVLDKLIEEAGEITAASNPTDLEAEIGDLLFSAVNLARWRTIDAESALRATNVRFTRRFKKMEALAAAQDKNLSDIPTQEIELLWEAAKRDQG